MSRPLGDGELCTISFDNMKDWYRPHFAFMRPENLTVDMLSDLCHELDKSVYRTAVPETDVFTVDLDLEKLKYAIAKNEERFKEFRVIRGQVYKFRPSSNPEDQRFEWKLVPPKADRIPIIEAEHSVTQFGAGAGFDEHHVVPAGRSGDPEGPVPKPVCASAGQEDPHFQEESPGRQLPAIRSAATKQRNTWYTRRGLTNSSAHHHHVHARTSCARA
ncbi:hypothetical protein quinque_008745 [Culex quinquefasciatus]